MVRALGLHVEVPHLQCVLLDEFAARLDTSAVLTQLFFQTVQNEMHWAAPGHTAAEVVRQRADASKPNMGLSE